ncbi:MAG: hypothetical protein AVDCRST_MAG52-3378, partial [uncultured Blastococcus sp.]
EHRQEPDPGAAALAGRPRQGPAGRSGAARPGRHRPRRRAALEVRPRPDGPDEEVRGRRRAGWPARRL